MTASFTNLRQAEIRMDSLPEYHHPPPSERLSQHSSNGRGTVAFPIFLLQFDKEQLCIGCFHTSYRLCQMFPSQAILHCNISLFRILPYSCFCFQISVYQFRQSSVRPRYLQAVPNLCFTVFPTHEGRHGFTLKFICIPSFQLYAKCGFPS